MRHKIIYSLLLAMVAVASLGLTGCSAPGMTRAQVHQRHVEAIKVDMWQFQDDIDAVFLFDRPGRIHRLTVR